MRASIFPQSEPNLNSDHSDELPANSIDGNNNWLYASYLLVVGARIGSISVKGLDVFEKVAEKSIFEALQDASVVLSIREAFIRVKPSKLQAFQFDLAKCPHLCLPLILLAAKAKGTTVLDNVQLLEKQLGAQWSYQLETLSSLGINIKTQDNLLLINGSAENKRLPVENTISEDPLMILCQIILALDSDQKVTIENIERIEEVFPDFISDLNTILTNKIELFI